jgi:hypothetical protein
MQAKQQPLAYTVYPAMPSKHKFFIEQTFLGDMPIDIMVCGKCGYSTTRVYVDLS